MEINKYQNSLCKSQYLLNKHLFKALPNYAVIKGIPLSNLAYNSCSARKCSDIDILVSRKDIYDCEKILHEYGYQQFNYKRQDKIFCLTNSHQVPVFYKKIYDENLYIDLNFEILWGEYEGKRIDVEEFLSDTIEMEIYGVKIKTLPPLKAMVQLILHHYKDMNSIFILATRNSIKFDMFNDIYNLLKNNLDKITMNQLYAISSTYEIIPYVFYILYYTSQVFNDEILRQYIDAFWTPEGEALLNCYGLCSKERKKWRCDFKTRLEADNLYELIKNDLSEQDCEKIEINKRIFMGGFE